MIPPPPPGPPLIGPSIARLRLARGWSQSRLAAELCAAAGVPTLSRHEVSRWERQLRVPGDFWLGWLAVVLAAPGDLLPDAAAWTRRLGTGPAAAGGGTGGRSRSALLALAQRWLADPHGPALGAVPTWLVTGDPYAGPGDDPYAGTDGDPYAGTGGDRTTGTDGDPAPGMRDDPVAGVGGDLPAGMHDDLCAGVGGDRAASDAAARLAGLRRLDDLAGGADLTGTGRRELRRIARGLVGAGPADRRRLMPLLAEAAQLCGWLAADAGAGVEGLDAYRLGLRAAVSAGDPAFA
ncbi:helix-turn-helix domain-containing protein, partial [Micromonospora rosaria]